MKKILISFFVILSVLSVAVSAKTITSEYEGFKCTWIDGDVYIEGKGTLPEKVFSNLFARGTDDIELETTSDYQAYINKIELSEGITEVPQLSYRITVNYTARVKNFVFPSTVTSFDLSNTYNIEEITVHKDNRTYASLDGVLYSKDMSTIILYPTLHTGKHLEIPESVTKLNENFAYKAKYLESVVIPEGVTEIPGGAFSTAQKLKYAKIPSSIKTIGEYAFSNTALTEVQVPDGVTILPDWAFAGAPVERIYIPKSVTKINSAAFTTKNTKFVYYGGTAEDWANIQIKNVQSHLSNDFSEVVFRYNATGLPEVEEKLEITPLNNKYPSGYLNDDKTVAWYVDENYVLHVHGYGKIRDVSAQGAQKPWTRFVPKEGTLYLHGLIVHEGITEIGSHAFDVFSYDTIELPSTIKKIGFGAFFSVFCDKLVIKSCPSLEHYTFPRINAKEVILPSNLVMFDPGSFVAATGFSSLTLPITLKVISPQSFPSCVTDIYYEGNEKDWAKINKTDNYFKNITIHFLKPSFFTDVPEKHWGYKYIKELYDKGIINGITETTFEPESTLTWGQALKLLLVSCGHGNLVATRSHWASGFLDYAKYKQWVGPNEISDAQLDDKITRLRFCQLAAGVKMIVAQPATNPFTDTDDVMVLALYNAGIISGMTETEFSPHGYLTRAQIAKIISLLIK